VDYEFDRSSVAREEIQNSVAIANIQIVMNVVRAERLLDPRPVPGSRPVRPEEGLPHIVVDPDDFEA
jgi:hypothetical protein